MTQDLFKSLVWDTLSKAAIQRGLVAALGGTLAGGPLGAFLAWLAGYVSDWLYAGLKLTVSLELIVLSNAEHRAAFNTAAAELRAVAVKSGIDSPEFKEARDAHKKALAVFVHFDV